MAPHDRIVRDVIQSPPGPKVGAFFDVDRTLLAGYSAAAFFRDQLAEGRLSLGDFFQSASAALKFSLEQTSFPTLIEESSAFAGLSTDELAEVGERVFDERLASEIFPESRALVRSHQRMGHTVAIVSSATHFQVDALARELEIEHVMCTELEMKDGRFTGRVERPACFREGKLNAASAFADEHGIDLDQSFFYSDSFDDVSLLDRVGHPRLVNPDRRLAELARRSGWPVLTFDSRGRPGLGDFLRLGLSLGSLGPAAAVGIPVALATGSLRRGLDVGVSTYSDLSTAFAGVDLQIEGEEHLWSQRPAVFIFNHQTGLDPLLMARMLRREVVGVAKAELKSNPFMGPLLSAAGTVFIERDSGIDPAIAMRPAVDALREGNSLLIAPEGTRSATQRLGAFKKGAFHTAMAARVPIVPIVLKNALDALPRKAIFIRPATVEVVVHPPIPTEDWTRGDLDERMAEIHRFYVETLDI